MALNFFIMITYQLPVERLATDI